MDRLTTPERGAIHTPRSWSPDGSTLLFNAREGPNTSIWMLTVKDKKVTRFGGDQLTGALDAEFSPDGRLVSYTTTGPRIFSRLFLERFPVSGAAAPISNGNDPVWSPDGKQLFFGSRGALFAADVVTQPALAIAEPEQVAVTFLGSGQGPRNYDVMPDGKRFVGVVTLEDLETAGRAELEFHVVLNWFDELKRLVPTN